MRGSGVRILFAHQKISKIKHIRDASVFARGFAVATFVPAPCVGRDCESSLRAIHGGVSLLDLLLFKCDRRLGAEIKWMDARPLTSARRIALANLQLDARLPR
jgi:hypothetical protein